MNSTPGGIINPALCHEPASELDGIVRLRVLVVEDNPTNRQVVQAMLIRMGQHVDLVENGAEAIAAVQRTEYDLVLMDVQMPDMDGHETTRRIRALDDRAAAVRIVALTTNTAPGDEALSRLAGMDGHLAKPLSCQRLRALLADWTAAAAEVPAPGV